MMFRVDAATAVEFQENGQFGFNNADDWGPRVLAVWKEGAAPSDKVAGRGGVSAYPHAICRIFCLVFPASAAHCSQSLLHVSLHSVE